MILTCFIGALPADPKSDLNTPLHPDLILGSGLFGPSNIPRCMNLESCPTESVVQGLIKRWAFTLLSAQESQEISRY